MSVWIIAQIALNILFALSFALLWTRLRRPAKDDPRMSRGLQLLQSKIAVLEDLSDKADKQANQLLALLEKKSQELNGKANEASRHVNLIEKSIQKSLEVAKIFEDRIPHEEIIERQKTKRYIHAAQLAHKGVSVDEIVREVGLPKGEVEIITKVNRENLRFSSEEIPAWAVNLQPGGSATPHPLQNLDFQMQNHQISEVVVHERPRTLEKLGEEFRRAVEQKAEVKAAQEQPKVQAFEPRKIETRQIEARQLTVKPNSPIRNEQPNPPPARMAPRTYQQAKPEPKAPAARDFVRPVKFPRVSLNETLG